MDFNAALKETRASGEMAEFKPLPYMISAARLQQTDFPPVSWLVEEIVPEGLTLLAGKPKLGKSWLSLHLGYAVATGGDFLGRSVSQGAVLYAALEDNERRLKARLNRMVPQAETWPESFCLSTQWPRLDDGGLDAFESYLDQNQDARCLIVDTLATVRPGTKSSESQYSGDYAAMRGLHRLANDRGIAVIVIHHVRKAEAEDPFDTVSGSTGLTGAADSTLILTKNSDGCVFYGRGRDLQEFETAVEFNTETCLWSDLGNPSLAFASETKRAILAAMSTGNQTPVRIADVSGVPADLTRQTLKRMADRGEISKDGRGCYILPSDPLSHLSQCHNGSDKVTDVTGSHYKPEDFE